MSYGGVLFGLALLSPVLFQPTAVAQPAPQAVDDKTDQALALGEFFPPRDLVALGPFKRITENVPSLSLHVDPHVIEIVKNRNGKIKIAYLGDTVDYTELLEATIDETSGAVSLNAQALAGRYVVVSESISNEFPIATQWKQTLNNGHGGREIGGTDAVGGMDGTYRPEFYDNNRDSPYLWNPKNYLFSTDGNAPNAALPNYERYPGEDYGLLGLSRNYAKELSMSLARNTGFSARHLNGRGDCRAADVIPEAPFFQVVHACPIGQGDRMSLATLVIPPRWNPSRRYPVLLHSDRDLHYTFHEGGGRTIGMSIGRTINSLKGSAIGVVWNAGAAFGSSGLHRSMYDNASRVFDLLKTSFSADTDKIITVGCSRGGGQALAIAGNPYPHSYNVKEVLAYYPDVAPGTRYSQFTSPTYSGLIYNRGIFTGYKYAWREHFREEQTGYRGFEVILKNTFGTVDPAEADRLSPISDDFLSATKTAGTRINLSIVSHDQFMPFANNIRYVNKADSYGIPMRVRIHYRGIHCGDGNMDPIGDAVDALARVNTGDNTFPSEIKRYARTTDGGFEEINQQPVSIELPKYVIPNGTFMYTVSGAPGVYFRLKILGTSQSFSGRLPSMDPGAPLQISTYTERLIWPATVPVGKYSYKLSYGVDNPDEKEATFAARIDAGGGSYIDVRADEPMDSSEVFCNGEKIRCRDGGWGLSSH